MTLKQAVEEIMMVSEPHALEFHRYWMAHADWKYENYLQSSDSVTEVLINAFEWHSTPQGMSFWVELFHMLDARSN